MRCCDAGKRRLLQGLPPMRCCDAGKRRLLQGLPPMRNVGGHASQRDTSHVIATYALLRAETPFRPYNGANVGGHASQRDTSHVCATYMLLRRRKASPPTYRPVGELFGEMSGEVLAKHLTIRNARQQRALVHFGEVLGRKSVKVVMQTGEKRPKLSDSEPKRWQYESFFVILQEIYSIITFQFKLLAL